MPYSPFFLFALLAYNTLLAPREEEEEEEEKVVPPPPPPLFASYHFQSPLRHNCLLATSAYVGKREEGSRPLSSSSLN